MSTVEYSLFRVKYVKPRQALLFGRDLTPRDFLLQSLEERPSIEVRAGYVWHIGNLQRFSNNTGYFAVGRTTKTTISKFDVGTGNFIVEETESSPYTHCVYNAEIGFIGIAAKPNLAPTTIGIAAKARLLLASTNTVRENEVEVELAAIPDPEDFVRAISSAYGVYSFAASFHGPNPVDADEYFGKRLSALLQKANGQRGRVKIVGRDLDRDFLQGVARRTAATGDRASARIRREKDQKPITVNMEARPVTLQCDAEEHDPKTILEEMTLRYHQVRESERNSDTLD